MGWFVLWFNPLSTDKILWVQTKYTGKYVNNDAHIITTYLYVHICLGLGLRLRLVSDQVIVSSTCIIQGRHNKKEAHWSKCWSVAKDTSTTHYSTLTNLAHMNRERGYNYTELCPEIVLISSVLSDLKEGIKREGSPSEGRSQQSTVWRHRRWLLEEWKEIRSCAISYTNMRPKQLIRITKQTGCFMWTFPNLYFI